MYNRKCPKCKKDLIYKRRDSWSFACKKNSVCVSCRTKLQYIKDPLKNKGSSNGRSGKNLFSLWKEKYGEELAQTKIIEWKDKLNKFKTGNNNPMYGKSPPENAGRPYKGWYKGLFFRSTLELAFIIKYELEHKILPISADLSKFRIKYTDNFGVVRTYVPDFVCEKTKSIFELKCSRFVEDNTLKHLAAKKEYPKIGYSFSVITESNVGIDNFDTYLTKIFVKYVDSKLIKLTDISIIKLNKRLKRGCML